VDSLVLGVKRRESAAVVVHQEEVKYLDNPALGIRRGVEVDRRLCRAVLPHLRVGHSSESHDGL